MNGYLLATWFICVFNNEIMSHKYLYSIYAYSRNSLLWTLQDPCKRFVMVRGWLYRERDQSFFFSSNNLSILKTVVNVKGIVRRAYE